jgi:hypothetical protein
MRAITSKSASTAGASAVARRVSQDSAAFLLPYVQSRMRVYKMSGRSYSAYMERLEQPMISEEIDYKADMTVLKGFLTSPGGAERNPAKRDLGRASSGFAGAKRLSCNKWRTCQPCRRRASRSASFLLQ